MKWLRGLLAGSYPFLVFAGLHWLEPRWGAQLLYVPVWINAALLFAFARTLRGGPTLVETLARLQDPDLSPAQVRHCRHFTIAWCAFFAANAVVCTALAWRGDLWTWTLYTGVVSYLLMGALFAAEVGVRYWRFRNYQGSLFAPLFRRVFPEGPRA